jgi:hypothetical protein
MESAPPHYTSFILRCHVDTDGRVRARLVDVRSGISCPIGDLEEVPGIVRGLLTPVAEDDEV